MTEAAPDPSELARRGARARLPKRFYKQAAAEPGEGGFVLKLDGRAAKTPGRRPLAVSSRAAAEALAAEWNAVEDEIDSARMPLTRIVNAAVDRVPGEIPAVRAEIVRYAGSDMICYRADAPDSLVEAQEKAWGPLIALAKEKLGARLRLAVGVMHVAQDTEALAAIEKAVERYDPLRLAALSVVTTLTGSAIVALALAEGWLTPDAAWQAAHVDEDWQMARWGMDEVALRRRAARRVELDAAAIILRQ